MSRASNPPPNEERVVHEYGDIQEYDNHLPNWWLWSLFGTIVFAIGYWFYYHGFNAGELPVTALQRENVEAAQRSGKGADDSTLTVLAKDPSMVKQGQETFTTLCAPCHAPTAGGNIGPNLTDEYWLHGGAPTQIYKTVKEGFIAKGMPAWGPQIGEAKTQAVTAWLISIRNTHVPGGKPPQGDKYAQNP
jgi:cytochrome c oxidase cbb3-type subunit 3